MFRNRFPGAATAGHGEAPRVNTRKFSQDIARYRPLVAVAVAGPFLDSAIYRLHVLKLSARASRAGRRRHDTRDLAHPEDAEEASSLYSGSPHGVKVPATFLRGRPSPLPALAVDPYPTGLSLGSRQVEISGNVRE